MKHWMGKIIQGEKSKKKAVAKIVPLKGKCSDVPGGLFGPSLPGDTDLFKYVSLFSLLLEVSILRVQFLSAWVLLA